ncbi:MAG: hypothetical protein WBA93_29370 [Microcoleaceae cyanobacterium]
MPEAELPGNQHLPEKNDPIKNTQLGNNQNLDKMKIPLAPESEILGPEVDYDWEVVDFPNAISIDSIPVVESGEAEAETRHLEPKTQTQPKKNLPVVEKVPSVSSEGRYRELKSENIMEALHECNRELVNRVTELETALAECEKTLENQERLLEERTQELASTQQQVTKLFYKLELCNQVIQRQEVLVESLTHKWEESQQQQAQMERQCVLTQQSYNEQSYHLKELENSCQELRSRLYRQQRQTLKFKAALERCLEMPGRMDVVNQSLVETTLAEEPPVTEAKVNYEAQSTIDQNPFSSPNLQSQPLPVVNSQPVKPWSPPIKAKEEEEETISSKSEETIAKISFGKKVDLPQGLELPQPETTSDRDLMIEELDGDVRENQLNPSLPPFTRIAEVPTYELDESEQVFLGEIEAAEYVVIENDLAEYQNQQPEPEITPQSYITEEFIGENISQSHRIETNIKTKRISWNISTGNWNVSEYQLETEPETDIEDFPEVPEIVHQDGQKTVSQLDLPTWNLPIVEPVVAVAPQQQRPSLAAIDLPTFPKIPIEEQPSAVGG